VRCISKTSRTKGGSPPAAARAVATCAGASRGAGSRDVVEVADTDSDIEVIADDGAAVRKRAAAALARSKLPVISALRRTSPRCAPARGASVDRRINGVFRSERWEAVALSARARARSLAPRSRTVTDLSP
jgi:hypothetical protein